MMLPWHWRAGRESSVLVRNIFLCGQANLRVLYGKEKALCWCRCCTSVLNRADAFWCVKCMMNFSLRVSKMCRVFFLGFRAISTVKMDFRECLCITIGDINMYVVKIKCSCHVLVPSCMTLLSKQEKSMKWSESQLYLQYI